MIYFFLAFFLHMPSHLCFMNRQAKIMPSAKNQYHAMLITSLLNQGQTVIRNRVQKNTLSFNSGRSYHFIFLTKDSATFFKHIGYHHSLFVLVEYMLFGKSVSFQAKTSAAAPLLFERILASSLKMTCTSE